MLHRRSFIVALVGLAAAGSTLAQAEAAPAPISPDAKLPTTVAELRADLAPATVDEAAGPMEMQWRRRRWRRRVFVRRRRRVFFVRRVRRGPRFVRRCASNGWTVVCRTFRRW